MTTFSHRGWYQGFLEVRQEMINAGLTEIPINIEGPYSERGIYLLLDNINRMVEDAVGSTIEPVHKSFSKRGIQSQLNRLRQLMITSGYVQIKNSDDLNQPNFEGIFYQLEEIVAMTNAG